MPRGPRRRLLPALLALTTATALGGCSLVDQLRPGEASSTVPAADATTAPDPALQGYYTQKIAWAKCEGGYCAKLRVPIDYAKPGSGEIQLALFKANARKPSQRIGSLVVNPGGPGGSGVDYAKSADFIVGAPVRQRFDIVGFDPRGVKRSAPVYCFDDKQMDAMAGEDPTPDTAAEEKDFAAMGEKFATACAERNPKLIGHLSTVDAAKDMDVLRAALGESRLHYLGKSYGTFLGATYADLFPTKVGRFVLDGVIAPDLTSEEVNAGQAEGFERATKAWAANCVAEGRCPLGTTQDEVMSGLRALLKKLDANPVPASGRAGQHTVMVGEGWASTGIAAAMYDQGMWSMLTEALREVVDQGRAESLMGLANQYAERDPSGHYTGNIMQVIYAVNCLDKPEKLTLGQYRTNAQEARTKAPTWGPYLQWSSLPCSHWAAQGVTKPHTIAAKGSGPIVVIGTTRDPATPYEWAVRLRKQLANGALITFDGDGHTAYTRSNACVDGAVNDYYVTGKQVQDGLRC